MKIFTTLSFLDFMFWCIENFDIIDSTKFKICSTKLFVALLTKKGKN